MNQAADPDLPTPPPVSAPVAAVPPPMLAGKTSSWQKLVAILLSLFLGLFLASGIVSVLDDSIVLLSGVHACTVLSGILTFLTTLAAILVYVLMGLSPTVPKRVVLPVVLFMAVVLLAGFPVVIYAYKWALAFDLLASFGVVILGLGMIRWLQGSWKFHWQLVPVKTLGTRGFSWLNLLLFMLLNLFVALPAVALYLGGCAGLAVSHFTDGFVSLRPSGIVMQARKYTRGDGKTILLFPMSHVAESDFYRSVAEAVSTNSVVLMEGVSDTNNLLTHKLSYRRAAKSLHLAEQHEDFNVKQGELVRADVDISEFSSNTIALLNLVVLVHAEGVNAHTLSVLLSYAPSPDMQTELFDDLLLKRNRHLLQVLQERLANSDDFVIPWGAAHMAGLAQEIQKTGFHLAETHDVVAIRFGGRGSEGDHAGAARPSEKTK